VTGTSRKQWKKNRQERKKRSPHKVVHRHPLAKLLSEARKT
jgi:hypothetical protein